MNSYYKKSVAVFGLLLPLLAVGLLAGGALFGLSSVNKKYNAKQKEYKKAQIAEKKTAQLQGMVAKNGNYLKDWQKILSTETRGTFVEHWKVAERKFSGKEFTRAPHNWLNYSEGLGKGINQPASQVEMNFSATYRAMQLALMEIESKLPQLQLDSLTMTPDTGSGKLNFKTKFTVWTQN